MQTQTQKRDSPKGSYFRQKADSFRLQMLNAEAAVIRYEGYEKQVKDAGKPIPKEIADALEHWRYKATTCRREMERALYNAGRL